MQTLIADRNKFSFADIFTGKARAYRALQKAKFSALVSELEEQCGIANNNGYNFKLEDNEVSIELVFDWPTEVQTRRYCADRDMSHRKLAQFIKWMEYLNNIGPNL